MIRISPFAIALALGLLISACQSGADTAPAAPTATASLAAAPTPMSAFGKTANNLDPYWHQGKAEISTYELSQNRYRDLHPGQAILIQVTEDFLTDRQVKNDRYRNPNSTGVLKTNFIRRFTTGIYDYSIMTSTFTPVKTAEFPFTLKTTTSVQDWCGHVFGQLNFREDGYAMNTLSYFESEGDQQEKLPAAILEDELFNRIRMNWQALPTGKQLMIPSLSYLRLMHKNAAAYEANISLGDYTGKDFTGEMLKVYRMEFPELDRRLEIVFSAKPPYYIEGWQDAHPSFDEQKRTSIARRKHTVLDDYWSHNAASEVGRRAPLGL